MAGNIWASHDAVWDDVSRITWGCVPGSDLVTLTIKMPGTDMTYFMKSEVARAMGQIGIMKSLCAEPMRGQTAVAGDTGLPS